MKTQGSWLFEAPLAHEMGKYGNPYSSQEYYYNPEFELARELQHELEAHYYDGKIRKIKEKPSNTAAPPSRLRMPQASIAKDIAREGFLTELANKIKGLGQGRGATVEIVLATTKDGKQILVAGINSGAKKGLNAAQLKQLEDWGVNVAPSLYTGKMDKGQALHAEENIAAYLSQIGARAQRWSKAVVGAWNPSGKRSYVCPTCKRIINRIGGQIENTPL